MASPNADKAANIGQDKTYKTATEACDAETGTYVESTGGKPTGPGPGPLPNTPSPMTTRG